MGTPYSKIFASFLNKVKDAIFFDMDEEDFDELATEHLKSAIVRFKKCKQDLSKRDDETKEFEVDLDDEEIEILSVLMKIEWLNTKIYTTDLLKQRMSSRDASFYSQAQHLDEMMKLRNVTRIEARQLISNYSYNVDDLGDLK